MKILPKSMLKIKALIVEDHALVGEGIEDLLTSHLNMAIVGRVNNGLDVYSACQQSQPDIVLMDLGLPGMNGIDIIQRLNKRWPTLCIVVLTACAMECKAREAIAIGAKAYVLKHSGRQVLFTAVKAALSGKCFIDPELKIDTLAATESFSLKENLTKREQQTLKLISEGHKNSDIAEKLSISLKTVETHRLNLMKKLGVHNVAELMVRSHRLGLVLM